MKVTIFDTSICSPNLGDFIIMDSVKEQMELMFSEATFFYSVTHTGISRLTYGLVKNSKYSFIGGTNLLSSNMNAYNQWKINLLDTFHLSNVILMGVGWWQYQKKPNLYTRYLLKSVLNKKNIHSVRDSYTKNMLNSIGINNVCNTGCPTMWSLTSEHCKSISPKKAESVVFTLTDYNKNQIKDRGLIDILMKNYKTVYYWPQGTGDDEYLKELGSYDKCIVLPQNLKGYNTLLDDPSISLDYIGTRLHAGIRALQKKKRTIIISIDNRTLEKQKDFNLNICERNNIGGLRKLIINDLYTKIKIPEKKIMMWKKQFKSNDLL